MSQDVTDTSTARVDELARAAGSASVATREASEAERAGWLRAIAGELDEHAGELIELADDETLLGATRLRGEVSRTTGQLRMFADVIEEGSYLEAIIDSADPSATPPRPGLRRILTPIGPVAVFAASNFPFAFSVAGGDTASALAVGCPVVVKAHPGHPRLSRRTAELVTNALDRAGAPAGTFALVEGFEAGLALVDHPAVAAVAFTGSIAAGRSLAERTATRAAPIPFFGELGSINPVVVTARADRARGAELAAGLAASFQLGNGQFCTKPGVVFVPRTSVLRSSLPASIVTAERSLLTASIARGFSAGVDRIRAADGVEVVGDAAGALVSPRGVTSAVFAVSAAAFTDDADALLAEVFGPVTILVEYGDDGELLHAVRALGGTLTATLHAEPGECPRELVQLLETRAGRIVFDGWPTGVAVAWGQHHGGPWPATTSQHTSVGATAVRRFQRPLVYQDAPPSVLPAALRDDNPLGIPRRIDGALVLASAEAR